jgi:AGCS family alanine or glycine:cation symporter
VDPRQQACIAVVGIVADALICTCSFGVALLSGLWLDHLNLSGSDYILHAFESYFKNGTYFLSLIIFLAGFTTIQAYFVVGMKSASYLSARWGRCVYMTLGIVSFWIFSFYDQARVLTVMRLASGLLVLINLTCLFRLRRQVTYDLDGIFTHKSI